MTNKTAREALAIALTGMMNDGDITRERALELARMVLKRQRENALQVLTNPQITLISRIQSKRP